MQISKGIAYLAVVASIAMGIIGSSCKSSNQKQSTKPLVVQMQTLKISPELLAEGVADTIKFGRMRSGEIIPKSLKIENESDKAMVLLRHVTSCGCVTVEYERKPISPKQSSVINFTYDSRGQQGWQMKLMEFYFADSATPMKIYFDAEVE